MKSIKKKLSSNSGASMLLALVFLMFCMFVGGSVLAAASANGSRAARQKENQQAYLSQRSASLLLADLLKGDENSAMQLTLRMLSRAREERLPLRHMVRALSLNCSLCCMKEKLQNIWNR